jgi:hypothetical protein
MPINQDALIQMMSAMGAGLNQQPWTQNINQLLQGAYGAKKQAGLIDMMKQIIGGEMPGAKASIGEDGVKLNLPANADIVSEAFGTAKAGAQASNIPTATGTGTGQAGTQAMGAGNVNLLNPSSSQPGMNLTAADLVGLTPQDVNAALSGALNVEQLRQKKVTDVMDMIYKGALTKEAVARSERMNLPEDTRTAAIKNYEYYLEGGGTKSFDEFSAPGGEPTSVEEWKQAQAGGYGGTYYEWKKEMATLGSAERPDRVTWTTATRELTKRFGKLDPTGMWAVTPELQNIHRLAQTILTNLRDEGVEPLKAVNEAENRSRKINRRYQQYIDAANTQIKDPKAREAKIAEINRQFESYLENYGR